MWGVAAVEDASRPTDADAVLRSISHALHHDTQAPGRHPRADRPGLDTTPDAACLLAPVDDYLLVTGLADSWDPDVHDAGARPLPPLDTARLTALRLAGRRVALRTAGLLHQLVTGSGHDPSGALPEDSTG